MLHAFTVGLIAGATTTALYYLYAFSMDGRDFPWQ